MKRLSFRLAPTAALVMIGLSLPAGARADVITRWNQQVVTSGGPAIQRTFAMVHLAMFDAANAIEQGYTPYLSNLPTPPSGASAEAAAAGAAYGVLVRLFPQQQPALAAVLVDSLSNVPDGPAKSDGIAYGDHVANALYTARLNDNILAPGPVFVPDSTPGDYQLTTSMPPQPVNTGAPSWIPFALTSASQFRPNGPTALTSMPYARDLEETKRLGGTISAVRTAEHQVIARWHTEQAQFQFNRIARSIAIDDGHDVLSHARLFALLNLALADAVTSVFDAKYTYCFWRPVTAIRNADLDDNSRTSKDPTWTPFLPTPPHPEYPAAHSVVQGAAARVMTWFYGPRHPFETTSPTVPGVIRPYASFNDFADEGFVARIYGGMHFRSSLEEGARQGKKVGNWVVDHYLVPLK
jgi:hypothetical protein